MMANACCLSKQEAKARRLFKASLFNPVEERTGEKEQGREVYNSGTYTCNSST